VDIEAEILAKCFFVPNRRILPRDARSGRVGCQHWLHSSAAAATNRNRFGNNEVHRTAVRRADFSDLTGCSVILMTAGINEKIGGATDRNDIEGRLKLFAANAKIYENFVPNIVAAAPNAVIIVITDPPDPLTDFARARAGHRRVFGAGTFLDSLRFRTHLAATLALLQAPRIAQSSVNTGPPASFSGPPRGLPTLGTPTSRSLREL
jgi:hypothetical protein